MWLSSIHDLIDFDGPVHGQLKEPSCAVMAHALVGETVLDQIPGVQKLPELKYEPETSLKDALQTLGVGEQENHIMGTRIARALNQVWTEFG